MLDQLGGLQLRGLSVHQLPPAPGPEQTQASSGGSPGSSSVKRSRRDHSHIDHFARGLCLRLACLENIQPAVFYFNTFLLCALRRGHTKFFKLGKLFAAAGISLIVFRKFKYFISHLIRLFEVKSSRQSSALVTVARTLPRTVTAIGPSGECNLS